jgi:hypothetical protein
VKSRRFAGGAILRYKSKGKVKGKVKGKERRQRRSAVRFKRRWDDMTESEKPQIRGERDLRYKAKAKAGQRQGQRQRTKAKAIRRSI